MGATTEQWRYGHKVWCLYSGNEGKIFTVYRNLNENDQLRLNYRFMKEKCTCDSCLEKRKQRAKVIEALKRVGAYHELELLGENNG